MIISHNPITIIQHMNVVWSIEFQAYFERKILCEHVCSFLTDVC